MMNLPRFLLFQSWGTSYEALRSRVQGSRPCTAILLYTSLPACLSPLLAAALPDTWQSYSNDNPKSQMSWLILFLPELKSEGVGLSFWEVRLVQGAERWQFSLAGCPEDSISAEFGIRPEIHPITLRPSWDIKAWAIQEEPVILQKSKLSRLKSRDKIEYITLMMLTPNGTLRWL